MNISRRNPVALVLAIAFCWTLSGCKSANWQRAGYGPGSTLPGAGQFPGGPPSEIDLGNPAEEIDSFDNSSGPELSEPRTFESERPVIPPGRPNPSHDIPGADADRPEATDGELSVPQAQKAPAERSPRRLFVPPLRGPIRLGESTFAPFPEGRWRPPANSPIASRGDEPEKTFPDLSPQPLPLTRKAEPRGSFEFPFRRPEDVLNASPETFSPDDGFDLPPLVNEDAHEKPEETRKEEPGPALPVLEEPVIAEAVPEFEVQVPPTILVGEATSIAVRIAAAEGDSFKDLKLIVTPDAGLVSPSASDGSALILECPELSSGQSHKLSFNLQAVSSGAHEFTVSLQSGENELAWKKLNLSAQPRQLMTQLIGPERKPVNGRAEFTLKIENVSQQALGRIEAILEFDSTLVPMEASAGAEQNPGQLVWSFPVLHPGEMILLQAEYACPVESGSTLVSSYVSIEDGPAQVRQSSVAVQRAAGTLQVEVLDRHDLSTVDRELTGIVRITNLGLQPARELKVGFALPELLGFTQVTAAVGNETVEIKQEVKDGTYTFTLPSELPSEQSVELAITFNTLKAGDGILQVEATAAGISKPVRAAEPFTVTP